MGHANCFTNIKFSLISCCLFHFQQGDRYKIVHMILQLSWHCKIGSDCINADEIKSRRIANRMWIAGK